MRALGPASHCSLDTSSDLSFSSAASKVTAIHVRAPATAAASTTKTRNKNKPQPPAIANPPSRSNAASPQPATGPSTSSSSSSSSSSSAFAAVAAANAPSNKSAALTDAALTKRPRAIRPALHPQAPRAPSIRSSSDSLSLPPSRPRSRSPTALDSNTTRRTSLSPIPVAPRASTPISRSASASSAASTTTTTTTTTRPASATFHSSGSSTSTTPVSATAAKPRRSLGTSTTATSAKTRDNRERRKSAISTTSAASTHLLVPRPTSAASATASRPLSPRLHNGALRTFASAGLVKQPPTIQSGTSPMPMDRTSHASTASRPAMPTLSASAMRAAKGTPLMPKVAAKGPQTPSLAHVSVTTPTVKRMSQPKSGAHHHHDTDMHHTEPTTPFLGSHITPRSGTRQGRVDSVNSTPTGTPNSERHNSWDATPGSVNYISHVENPNFRRSNASFTSTPGDHDGPGKLDSPLASDSKFFHASDVKPSLARPAAPAVKQTPTKVPTFFYANGDSVGNTPPAATQSAPSLAHKAQPDGQSKFLYANGAPELRPSPPLKRGSTSSLSGFQYKPGSRPNSGSQITGFGTQRPLSPVKVTSPSQPPSVQSIPPGTARSHVTSPPPGHAHRNSMRRTSSGTSSRVGGHSRSGSLVSGEHVISAVRLTSPQLPPYLTPEPVSPLHAPSTPAPLTLASIIQAATEIDDVEPSETSSVADTTHSEMVQSPTRSTHSNDPISELVSNARRERKVQDLEITNASLEAINRTLERQLKKQSAEIRRFRRMSRTARLSLASTGLSDRESSEGLHADNVIDLSLTDLSEEPSELDDDLEDESYSDTESTSGSLSPSVIAERDARHRKRDEKRLRLDLTKHQEILVDSQKLNQSIIRCMNWTEELIREGQKALEYHVRVSEVKIGGRVLDPLDEEEDTVDDPVLGSFGIDATLAELDGIAADLDIPTPDRDSGVGMATKG